MKKSRFTEERVAYALRQSEAKPVPRWGMCAGSWDRGGCFLRFEEEVWPVRGDGAAQDAYARGGERVTEAPGGGYHA